jgi:hypothetical protein
MKQMKLKTIMLASLALCAGLAVNAETPKGWFAAGSHPKEYEMTLDQNTTYSGKGSASLKSIVLKASGFGTLMQTFKADDYRGKRLRMSGYVRAADVADSAGLWLRVDGLKGEVLSFDNMRERPITGTADWKKCEIVLDVPEASQQIAFGLLLSGTGQVWMDDVKFEAVGKEVPTTGVAGQAGPKGPRNLDFEE